MGKAGRVVVIVVAALFAVVAVMQVVTGRVGPGIVGGLIAWFLWSKVAAPAVE